MNPSPPKFASRFLHWFCSPDFLEEIEGNLIELYEQTYVHSPRKAKWIFFWNVLLHFRPDFMRSFWGNRVNPMSILRHNLLITTRHFKRHRSFFALNLLGLATGIACILFIFLWTQDESRVDQFHSNDKELYVILHHLENKHSVLTEDVTPYDLANTLAAEYPEVKHAVAVNDFFNWNTKSGVIKHNERNFEIAGLHASSDFFTVFSYPVLEDDGTQLLLDKTKVAISQSLAHKLFDTQQVVGETIEWNHPGYEGAFEIAAVFQDPPKYSSQQFDIVFPLELLAQHDPYARGWNGDYVRTYVVLHPEVDVSLFNDKIAHLLQEKNPNNEHSTFSTQLYSDQYLFGRYENGKVSGGRIAYVRLFSLIAFLILLIACANFTNLATAKASTKTKEIGIKKVVGAQRGHLLSQFFGESILLSTGATLLALILVQILLPNFNRLADKSLSLGQVPQLWVWVIGIALCTGLLAGAYPAIYLSRIGSKLLLQSQKSNIGGKNWVRNVLVVSQFSLSILFLIGLFVVQRQIAFVQTKQLGYDRDNILSFHWKGTLDNSQPSSNELTTFKQQLTKTKGVKAVTNMSGNILNDIYLQSGSSFFTDQEVDPNFLFQSPVVGTNFFATLGLDLIQGRSFSLERGDNYSKVILNEKAVALMGLENPLGQRVGRDGSIEIVGVVADFQYGSFHNSIAPLFFRFDPRGRHFMVKLENGLEVATIKQIAEVYESFLPGRQLDYSFMDKDYEALYKAEDRVASLSRYFAALAVIISCLGLFGLASFTAERRRKEIGIRKVLGANALSILRLLLSDYTKTILLAILISTPIGYLIANDWLNNFSTSISLHWGMFLGISIAVLLVAWLTVGLQTMKAASLDPVKVLKEE